MPTYNPKDIQVSVNGVPVTGYADGTDVIQVIYDSDFVADAVGVTGEGAFVQMNDRRANLILTLLATSLFNDVLSGLVSTEAEFAVAITDSSGNTLGGAAAARVLKPADVAFGNEVGSRQWTIRCLNMVMHVGGTTS